MKANRKVIMCLVLGILLAVLLFAIFSRGKSKDSGPLRDIEAWDSVIEENRRNVARETAKIKKLADSIAVLRERQQRKEQERQGNQAKQQNLKRKSEEIKNHINNPDFDRDSLRDAFSTFED